MRTVELLAIRDKDSKGMAVCLKPKIPYVMTRTLVDEIRNIQKKVVQEYYTKPWNGVYHVIWYLHAGNIPWKGFDFDFMYNSFLNNNELKVEQYIDNIFELLYVNYVGFGLPLISCSLVNRDTQGISREFFLLNRVNFIFTKNGKNRINNQVMNLVKIDSANINIKSLFSPKIYLRNSFYEANVFNISSIRKAIDSFEFEIIPQLELQEIKLYFDEIRDKTIAKIYKLANKNIHYLRRVSELQSFEHRKWTNYNSI